MALIEARQLTKVYTMGDQTVHALRGVSLDIEEGDFVAIMGASGSGKSTLMNILGCLDLPTEGEYRLAGEAVQGMQSDQLASIRNRRIGFVFQQFNLLPRTSALENVELPMVYSGIKSAERRVKASAALAKVGLGQRMDHTPSELSGGQQQRVAIARALVNSPQLILADEPTGALDSQTSEDIMHLLTDLNAQGMTVVLVTHEADIAAWARRKIVFKDGHIVEDVVRTIEGERDEQKLREQIPTPEREEAKKWGQIPIQESNASVARSTITKLGSDPTSLPVPEKTSAPSAGSAAHYVANVGATP